MRFLSFAVLIGTFSFALPIQASVVLGFAGVESGVPIAGQEDVVVYNFTGPSFGCSTPNGTPICTGVTFDNVILDINGSVLDLGNIAPGVTETLAYPSGIFPDSTISSLSFSATLSSSTLTDDAGHTFSVDPSISITGLPADGSLGAISTGLASVPEPSFVPFFLLCVPVGAILLRRRNYKSV